MTKEVFPGSLQGFLIQGVTTPLPAASPPTPATCRAPTPAPAATPIWAAGVTVKWKLDPARPQQEDSSMKPKLPLPQPCTRTFGPPPDLASTCPSQSCNSLSVCRPLHLLLATTGSALLPLAPFWAGTWEPLRLPPCPLLPEGLPARALSGKRVLCLSILLPSTQVPPQLIIFTGICV